MKQTGIIRRIDDLGRVVIPKEIRRSLRLREGDPLEVFVENGAVIYKKYSPFSFSGSIIEAAIEALNKAKMPFAIYDITSQVISGVSGDCNFPKFVPDEWTLNRHIFRDEALAIDVYPIIAEGEMYGYLAAVPADRAERLFVEAVVSMISASAVAE